MYLFTRPALRRTALIVAVSAVLAITVRQGGAQEESNKLQEQIRRLIEQLGDENFSVRQQAQHKLAELGTEACDALTAATTHEDLEIASRAKYLLRLMRVEWIAEDDPEPVKKLLEDYASLSSDMRYQRMDALARLPDDIGLPALCRLVRYEKSTVMSKLAAVAILDRVRVGRKDQDQLDKTLRKHLGSSQRTAATWLFTCLEFAKDPKAALDAWADLVEEEEAILERSPVQSNLRIVTSLLYHLALAQVDQGNRELAGKTAERARELDSSKYSDLTLFHLNTAYVLQRRGLFKWAELEYRHVIEGRVPEYAVFARRGLSEMLHDGGDDLRAAETVRGTIRLFEQNKLRNPDLLPHTREQIAARMNYFLACHWAGEGDSEKHRKYLDEAIKNDPAELDALIARYRLPNPKPQYHRKTLKLIENAASALREKIQKTLEKARYYNQFAWLIGNTEGDLDEALKYGKKAVELAPDSGAFLDTLAHVYFGRGDYENAVKYQTEAAELEPHSGLITKQLEFFRGKLKEKQETEKKEEPTPPEPKKETSPPPPDDQKPNKE